MIEEILARVEIAWAIVATLMLGDYWLTLLEQRAYRKHMARFVDVEQYEQNPLLAGDVARGRPLSGRHVIAIVIVCFVLWYLHRPGLPFDTAFEITFGAVALPYLELDLRHLRNWLGNRLSGAGPLLEGNLKVRAGYGQRQLTLHYLSLLVLWGCLFLLIGRMLFVGGALGSLASAARSALSARAATRAGSEGEKEGGSG